MKFSSNIALAALAVGSAVADNTLAERDLQTVTTVISNVEQSMRQLDQAVQSFNGDPNNLQRAAGQLVQTLQQGSTAVQGTTELTVQEAVTLQQSVGGLQTEGQSLVRNLESQKPRLQQANQCDTVRQSVGQVSQGATQLITAVVNKVPQGVRQIAQQMTQGLTQALSQTEQSFAPGSCVNANGQGGGVAQNGTTIPGQQAGNGQQVNNPGNGQQVNAARSLAVSVGGAVVAVAVASLML